MRKLVGCAALLGVLACAAFSQGVPVKAAYDQPQPTSRQRQVANASYAAEQREADRNDQFFSAERTIMHCRIEADKCVPFYARMYQLCSVANTFICHVYFPAKFAYVP